MSPPRQTHCPHCHAGFTVNEEQLQSADGKVRCGICLRVFDATSGEPEFVPPPVPKEPVSSPLQPLSVQPMENAELPRSPKPVPSGLKILVLALAVLLALQLLWFQLGPGRSAASVMHIAQLVVRAHPEEAQALRLDAILHNTSDHPQPYPALFLYLDNRYGERRAQRLFLPQEYLPPSLIESAQLPPRTRVQVSLALQDPGQGAVNYGVALQSVPSVEN